MKIEEIITGNNLAEELDEDTLNSVANTVLEEFEIDAASREEWMSRNEEYIKLATQVIEEKNFPFQGAANVKYPLLTTAALQFAARAYPALVQGNRPVKVEINGYDQMGTKMQQADRMSKHLSYQLLHKMEEWEEDMDRTMMILPILGSAFKKTYFCPQRDRNVSEYVSPEEFVINYYAKSVEQANRKTQVLSYYPNELVEFMRTGFFKEVDLVFGEGDTTPNLNQEVSGHTEPSIDYDTPFTVLEQHRLLDLDDDGYAEPYIVHVLEESEEVLRIMPRFRENDIQYNDDGQIAKIVPTEYFTGFVFIPNPVSNIYGLGFGTLLGPLNETANTLINQLLDAGKWSNMQGGFLGRNFKVKGGALNFKPGEWKTTQSTGDDLRKNIFPLPVREPSNVLFQLLGTVIEAGQSLSSTKDIMMGESPGQNQPATTTMAVLEQGLKVFTSIHKRIYRAMRSELMKLFKLNAVYMEDEEYFRILDMENGQTQPAFRNDYVSNLNNVDVSPAGDPNVVTQGQKLLKAEALLQARSAGMLLNPQEVTRRVLEAQEQPNIQTLMQVPPPQPDPEIVIKQADLQHRINYDNRKLELDAQRVASEAIKDESQGIYQRVKAEATMREAAMQELQQELSMVRESVQQIMDVEKERKANAKKVTRNKE